MLVPQRERRAVNAQEYEHALARIGELMKLDPAISTVEGRELENLALDVEQYERERYPLDCCAHAAAATAQRLLRLLPILFEFYEPAAAIAWCREPQKLLGGQTPLSLIVTEPGAADVFACVERLRDGAYV